MLVLFSLLTLTLASINVHFWQIYQSNEVTHCNIQQLIGNGSNFVNTLNQTIHEFDLNRNTSYEFGLVLGRHETFNLIYSLTCQDLTCSTCNNYIGPCPRIVFLISAMSPGKPIVNVINYSNSSYGTFIFYQSKMWLYATFSCM